MYECTSNGLLIRQSHIICPMCGWKEKTTPKQYKKKNSRDTESYICPSCGCEHEVSTFNNNGELFFDIYLQKEKEGWENAPRFSIEDEPFMNFVDFEDDCVYLGDEMEEEG